MDPKLHYVVTTAPFPLRAGTAGGGGRAALTVMGTNPAQNPDDNPVSIQAVAIRLPIGAGADQLTEDTAGIGPVAPTGWKMLNPTISTGTALYVFRPATGDSVQIGAQSVEFTFNNVIVNAKPGSLGITVIERTDGCEIDACPSTNVAVTKFPAGWHDVAFWASPTDVPRGAGTTLNWAGPEGATYSIVFFDWRQNVEREIPEAGGVPLASHGAWPGAKDPPLSLIRQTVFTLNVEMQADGQDYVAQDQKLVTVEDQRVQIISTKAVPDYAAPGTAVSLQWKTQGATAWTLNGPTVDDLSLQVPQPDVDGNQTQAGFTVYPPAGQSTYTLTASDAQGDELTPSFPVTVDPLIVTGQQTISMSGVAGSPGQRGQDGMPPEMPGAPGGPGGPGGPGPQVTVTIGQKHNLIQLTIEPEIGVARTLLVAPAGHVTVQSIGGPGGAGGDPGWGGTYGGPGGPGGPGGAITVQCAAALRPSAERVLTLETPGGPGGIGGTDEGEGPGPHGEPGPRGSVTWLETVT
jgi:hypothetical protein